MMKNEGDHELAAPTNCFVKRQFMVSCFVSLAREVFGVCWGSRTWNRAAGFQVAFSPFTLSSKNPAA